MSTVVEFSFKVIELLILWVSVAENMFILVVNITDLTRNKKLNVTDQLIAGISACHLLVCLHNIIYLFVLLVWEGYTFTNTVLTITTISSMAITSVSRWISAWLCVFFCLKIVNINQRFYVYLQRRFQKMLPCLTLLSTFGSVLLPILNVWTRIIGSPQNVTLGPSNYTVSGTPIMKIMLNNIPDIPHSAITALAFLLIFCSCLTIVASLCRHMRHMQDNAEGPRSASIEAYVNTTKMVTFLFIGNLLYFIGIALANARRNRSNMPYFLSISLSIFSVISPLILIKLNRKLSMKLTEMLTCRPFNNA